MKGDVKDRSVNLGLWKKIFPYSDLAIPTTGETSYSSTIFALAEMVATAFSMIKLVNFKYIYGDGDLPGWFHRMLYINVENLLSMQAFSDDLNVTLLIILSGLTFVFWTAIIVTIYSAGRKVVEDGSMSWLSPTSYFAIPSIRNALMLKSNIFMCPLIEICVLITKSPRFATGYRVLGVVVLISIVLDFFFIVSFSLDIHYRPRNMLQGRTYQFFLIKVLGLWVNIILKYIIADQDNYGMDVFTNVLTFLHASLMLFNLFQTKNYFLQPKLELTYGIMILVYLIESMGALIFSLNRDLKFVLDMDLVAIISYPLFYLLYRGIENKSSDDILSKRSHTSFDSLDSAILYLEKLFFCFGQAQDDRFKMYLQMNIVSHCNSCKDPMCLCPLLRETIDVKSGSAGRSAKNTFSQFINRKKGSSLLNSTVNFDTITHVEKLKTQNTMIAKLLTTGQRDELLIRRTDQFVEEEVYRVLTIDNPEKFNLVFCSFFGSTKKQFQGKDSFELMYSYFKFLLTEYNNPVTALYAIYDYIYSHEFQRDSSVPRIVLMQSLLRYSKRQALTLSIDDLKIFETNRSLSSRSSILIPKDEDFISSNLDHQSVGNSGFSMSQILGFRRRLHQVRLTNMDLILKKIKLYNWLFEPEGDFRVASALGSELYLKSRELKREIAELNLLDQLNPRLIREAIVYEVCVKERDSIPPDYAKRYREAVARFQVFSKSIHSVQSKNRFSPYSSTHVVIFARPDGEKFKISQFSENATSFFEAEAHQLQNANLSNFILPTLAKEHDELLHSYLNGEQLAEKKFGSNSIIHSVCRTKRGNLNSVMVIPRMEIVFTQDIFIAGLVTLRKKNQEPIIYSDSRGTVIGCNEAASVALRGSPSPNSMFLMCPRLKDCFLANQDQQSPLTLKQGTFSVSKTRELKTSTFSRVNTSKYAKKTQNNKEDVIQKGITEFTKKIQSENFQLDTFWFSALHRGVTEQEEHLLADKAPKIVVKSLDQHVQQSNALLNQNNNTLRFASMTMNQKEAVIDHGIQKIPLVKPGMKSLDPRLPTAGTRDQTLEAHDTEIMRPDEAEDQELGFSNINVPSSQSQIELRNALMGLPGNLPVSQIHQCTVDLETQNYARLPTVKELVLLGQRPASSQVLSLFNIWFCAVRDLQPTTSVPGKGAAKPLGSEFLEAPRGLTTRAARDPRVVDLLQLSPETVHQLFLLKDLVEKNLASQSPSSLSVIQHIFPEEFTEAEHHLKYVGHSNGKPLRTPDQQQLGTRKESIRRTKTPAVGLKLPEMKTDGQIEGSGAVLRVLALFQYLASRSESDKQFSPETPNEGTPDTEKPVDELLEILRVSPDTIQHMKADRTLKEASNLINSILEGISVDCGAEDPNEMIGLVLQPILIDAICRTIQVMREKGNLLSPIAGGNKSIEEFQFGSETKFEQKAALEAIQKKTIIKKPSLIGLFADRLPSKEFDRNPASNKEETSGEGGGVVGAAGVQGGANDNGNKLAMLDLNRDVSSLISSRLSNRSNQATVMMRWAISKSDKTLKYRAIEWLIYAVAIMMIVAKIALLSVAQSATQGMFDAQDSIRTVAISGHAASWLHKQSLKGLLQSKALETESVFYKQNNNGQNIFSPEFPAYVLKGLRQGQFELANNQFFEKTYILPFPSRNPLKADRASVVTLMFDVIYMYTQFQGFTRQTNLTVAQNKAYKELMIDMNDQTFGAYNTLVIKIAELSDATFMNVNTLNLMTTLLFCTNIFFCLFFIMNTKLMSYLQNRQLGQAVDLLNKVEKRIFLKGVDNLYARAKRQDDNNDFHGTIRGELGRFGEFDARDSWDADFQLKLRIAANSQDDISHPAPLATQVSQGYGVKVWEVKTVSTKDRQASTQDMLTTRRKLTHTDRSGAPEPQNTGFLLSPRSEAAGDASKLISPREQPTTYYGPALRKSSHVRTRSRDRYSKKSYKQARIQTSGLKHNILIVIAFLLYLPTIIEIVDYVGVNFNSVAMAERVNLMRASRRAPDYILASVIQTSLKKYGLDLESSTSTNSEEISQILNTIDQVRLNENSDIQDLLYRYTMCNATMMLKDANITDMDACVMTYNKRSNLTLRTGIDSVAIRLRGLSQYFDSLLTGVPREKLASTLLLDPGFWEIDMANFYTTVPWRAAVNAYQLQVAEVIRSGMNNYVWYTVAFIVGTLLLLMVLKLWWLQVLLHDWIQLKHTFLMQNQDVLTNPYVSSFFGKGAMSILGGIQGGNSGKH